MKLFIYLIVLLNLFLYSCQTNSNPCSLSDEVIKDLQEIDSLINVPELKSRQRDWMMNNYNEPSLLDATNESYRFLLSSSFEGTEIVRIERDNAYYNLIIKKYSSPQDTIGITKKTQISESKWNTIVDSLNILEFWTYPSHISKKGLDGESWILEGYKPVKDPCTLKNYHYITRWSPEDITYIKMCKLVYNLNKE